MARNRYYGTSRDKNEKEIVEYLQANGCLVNRIAGSANDDGVPDLLVGYKPRWILVEVKMPQGHLNKRQRHWFDLSQGLGLPVAIVRTLDDCHNLLRHYD